MKHIILILLIAGAFISCGENANEIAVEQKSSKTQMSIDITYKVYTGDKLVKELENSEVKITKNSNKDYSEVTLLSGKAYILRK